MENQTQNLKSNNNPKNLRVVILIFFVLIYLFLFSASIFIFLKSNSFQLTPWQEMQKQYQDVFNTYNKLNSINTFVCFFIILESILVLSIGLLKKWKYYKIIGAIMLIIIFIWWPLTQFRMK